MVARITSSGICRKLSSNEPISTTGHSTRPATSSSSPSSSTSSSPARRRGSSRRRDDLAPPLRIEHDLGLLELGHVVVEPAHRDRRRREEAMAAGRVAGCDAVDRKRHDVRLLGLRPEGRDDRMQRPHPVERARLRRCSPQRIDFGHGKLLNDLGHDFGDHLDRGAARLLDHRDVEVALLGPSGSWPRRSRSSPAALRKPAIAPSGAPTRGPFFSSADPAAAPACPARSARAGAASRTPWRPRRPDRHRPAVGDELLQILRRARLHARGDFLGEQFEQKIGHGG